MTIEQPSRPSGETPEDLVLFPDRLKEIIRRGGSFSNRTVTLRNLIDSELKAAQQEMVRTNSITKVRWLNYLTRLSIHKSVGPEYGSEYSANYSQEEVEFLRTQAQLVDFLRDKNLLEIVK